MLEELGVGRADDLAQLRKPEEFKTALLLERPNGEGHYIKGPKFDWAYAVARNYFYSLFKEARLEALMNSSYQPLVLAARKMIKEQRYHSMHWSVWVRQLTHGTDESHTRIQEAVEKVWKDLGSLFSYGPNGDAIVANGLIESQAALTERCEAKLKAAFEKVGLPYPGLPGQPELDGRAGEHTEALADAVNTLSEVYKLDPATQW
jgi:ring-1,2-phenylacetyl-CoA epoxidase subunit PaaC